jgi:(4S)-4-hydroxy-5-phosphonooxypentane-2,3-dione isomerase
MKPIVTLVHIWVKEEYLPQFIEITRYNHENTLMEPGNIRFDVLVDARDKCKFVLYEVFESEEAIAAHKETEHYNRWRETVTDWMSRPREGQRHEVISPENPGLW